MFKIKKNKTAKETKMKINEEKKKKSWV